MKTVKQQQEERRQAKLDDVQRKVASGSLVIRQMTSAERARYPAPPPEQGRQ